MRRKIYSSMLILFLVLTSFLWAFLFFNQFSKKLQKNLERNVKAELQMGVEENVNLLNNKFEDYFIMLEGISENIRYAYRAGDVNGPLNLLEYAYLGRHFGRMGLMDRDGVFHGADADYFVIADEELLQRITGRERGIFDYDLNIDGRRTISLSVPVYGEDNEIWATLVANVSDWDIRVLLDGQKDNLHTYIITDSGEFLSKDADMEEKSIFELLKNAKASKGYTLTSFGRHLVQKQEGVIRYTASDGIENYMYYKPLGIQNWFLVSIVPVNIIGEQSREIGNMAAHLSIEMVLVFVYVGVIFVLSQRSYKKSMHRKEKELESLTDSINTGLVHITDFNQMTISYGNESCYRLLGYSKEELQAKYQRQMMELICEENREGVKKEIQDQLRRGTNINLDFPIYQKNGNKVWLSMKGHLADQGMKLVCIFLDITRNRTYFNAMRMAQDKYHILVNQTSEIQFEYDIMEDRFMPCDTWVKKFGREPAKENFLTNLLRRDSIYEEDKANACNVIQAIKEGSPYEEVELRIRAIGDRFLWCRVSLHTVFNDENKPVSVIGLVQDIDRIKREKANQLPLPGSRSLDSLYTKTEVQLLIEEYLENKNDSYLCAFAVVDIDDFSAVNDKMGQLFGDNVLEDLSVKIKRMFRSSDIIGRIGGDQFIVFIKDLTSIKAVEQNAANICNIFRISYKGKNMDYHISGSIGISLYPEDGTTYEVLYQKAMMALYASKQKGKDRFGIYKPYMTEVDSKLYEDKKRGGSISKPDWAKTLLPDIVKLLTAEKDRVYALQTVLKEVGTAFAASRTYLWECANEIDIYEWCNVGIESKKVLFQDIESQDWGNITETQFIDDIFSCSDILQLPVSDKIRAILERDLAKSVIYIKIQKNDNIIAYLGLEQCGINRLWSEEEVEKLKEIAHILEGFLMQ